MHHIPFRIGGHLTRSEIVIGNEEARIALTTVSSRPEAQRIARALIESRLAACVNILGGIHSVFRWNEEVEEGDEFLLMIKTTEAKIPSVAETLKALHGYELPEFIVISVASGSEAYLKWIEACVR